MAGWEVPVDGREEGTAGWKECSAGRKEAAAGWEVTAAAGSWQRRLGVAAAAGTLWKKRSRHVMSRKEKTAEKKMMWDPNFIFWKPFIGNSWK